MQFSTMSFQVLVHEFRNYDLITLKMWLPFLLMYMQIVLGTLKYVIQSIVKTKIVTLSLYGTKNRVLFHPYLPRTVACLINCHYYSLLFFSEKMFLLSQYTVLQCIYPDEDHNKLISTLFLFLFPLAIKTVLKAAYHQASHSQNSNPIRDPVEVATWRYCFPC